MSRVDQDEFRADLGLFKDSVRTGFDPVYA